MDRRCLTCNSAVVLESGPRKGSLACFIKGMVRPLGTCQVWGPRVAAAEEPHRVQVKSGVECQIGTVGSEKAV